MSFQSKFFKIKDVLFNFNNAFCKADYLFIHSHMRSRSSLLAHILGSNTEIIGYSEQHRSYRNPQSFIDLRISLSKEFQNNFRNKILLDKLLHNQYFVKENLIKKYDPKLIFLIRKPEDTIKSIIHLGEELGIKLYSNQEWLLKYYTSRIDYLNNINSNFKNSFFIESDDLVLKPETILFELSEWLALKEPLTASYNLFQNSGKRLYGDPLNNIHAGAIVKTEKHDNILISPEILKKAETHYLNFIEKFNKKPSSTTG